MANIEVIVHFSNGEKINIDNQSIIFPIKLVTDNDKQFCSKTHPLIMDDVFHIHDGFIPELTTLFASNEFFTLDSENSYTQKVYKTSSIVFLEQKEKL